MLPRPGCCLTPTVVTGVWHARHRTAPPCCAGDLEGADRVCGPASQCKRRIARGNRTSSVDGTSLETVEYRPLVKYDASMSWDAPWSALEERVSQQSARTTRKRPSSRRDCVARRRKFLVRWLTTGWRQVARGTPATSRPDVWLHPMSLVPGRRHMTPVLGEWTGSGAADIHYRNTHQRNHSGDRDERRATCPTRRT